MKALRRSHTCASKLSLSSSSSSSSSTPSSPITPSSPKTASSPITPSSNETPPPSSSITTTTTTTTPSSSITPPPCTSPPTNPNTRRNNKSKNKNKKSNSGGSNNNNNKNNKGHNKKFLSPLSSSSSSSSKSTSSPRSSSSSSSSSWVHLRSVLYIVANSNANAKDSTTITTTTNNNNNTITTSSSSKSSSPAFHTLSSSDRGHKSPWSRRRRKLALTPQLWQTLFTPDGKLLEGGIKLLKKVRSGGIDPSIRAEVWPFLLGVYDLDSSKEERDVVRSKNRKAYEKLRKQCRRLLKEVNENAKEKEDRNFSSGNNESNIEEPGSPVSEDVVSARQSLSSEKESSDMEHSENQSSTLLEGNSSSQQVTSETPVIDADSSDSELSVEDQFNEASPSSEQEKGPDMESNKDTSLPSSSVQSNLCRTEDFNTWQRIIRLDAVRANGEWITYSPSQAAISEDRAHRCAEAVGLKDYEHLEPCRIYHAARLVAVLEAYSVYDSEIGYCQGMSDLLSPIISVVEEDHMAFWCFVGFMKKSRHNFRLDEVGIRRQLNIVAKIIKYKDSHLYRHLVKLQAEDCFFVYRMVVVLFRRELSFEQTLCLWEVMWADQAAVRAGIGKSGWSRIRQRAPPTDDLLLYAIAASVLQRRKQIIEKYSSMDEILRECNSMAGHLDVWKLLDDAHQLVMTLHDKVDSAF